MPAKSVYGSSPLARDLALVQDANTVSSLELHICNIARGYAESEVDETHRDGKGGERMISTPQVVR